MMFFSSIFQAAEQGDLRKVEKFLEKGQSPDTTNDAGETPLIVAARAGHGDVVKLLLSRGADVNRQGRRGDTPLYYAARNGHAATVELLLNHHATPDRCARKGITPLLAAAARGYDAIVELLAMRGADLEATEKQGRTALMVGIEKGHIAVVERLIALGANVEFRSATGETPLMQAVKVKDPDIVRRLLARGVDVDARNRENLSALQMAAMCGGYASAELLVEAGANVTQRTARENWGVVTLARNGGFERLASRLAELEQDHCRLPLPATLLDTILTGDLCLVRIFLRKNPGNVNAPVHAQGWTPLLVAINKGFFPMAEYFIQQGADVNHVDDRAGTALHQAVGKGSQLIVRRLLAAGADPTLTWNGVSAVDFAARSAHPTIVTLLQQHATLALTT